MPAWRFVLTDSTYRPVGEILTAYERKVALPLNKLPTASLRVRLDHPLGNDLLSCTGYLKAYRNGTLQFFGPIISAEENFQADRATIAVNAVGVGWYFSKRLAGKSAGGRLFAGNDRAQIVKTLINTTNVESETGIDTAAAVSAASNITYTAGPYKPISDCLNELALTLDGFDWRIDPIDNFAGGAVTGQKIGAFLAQPVFGSDRPDAVFEAGTGRNNIVEYTRAVTRDTQANQVFHIASPGADAPGFPVVSAIDASSIASYKLLEDLAQADLLDQTLRQRFVDEHIRVRRNPRQVITFQPHLPDEFGRVPQFGTDFAVADNVRARAQFGTSVRFDAMMRVWGVAFELNDEGSEKTTLTLAQE